MKCPRCDTEMVDIQYCHHFCVQCGGTVDCSD